MSPADFKDGDQAYVSLARDLTKQYPCRVFAVASDHVRVEVPAQYREDAGMVVGSLRVSAADIPRLLSKAQHSGRKMPKEASK